MANTETAILAGGCFWGMQDLIRKLPGIVSTRVGYSGGVSVIVAGVFGISPITWYAVRRYDSLQISPAESKSN